MNTLKKVPDEDVWYDFDWEVWNCIENLQDFVVIYGNRDFQEKGKDYLLRIVKEDDYYDYEEYQEDYPCALARLKKVTGLDWEYCEIEGYSQGDWQGVYYVKDKISQEMLQEIENFYMGKVDEFLDEETCGYFVPHSISWRAKMQFANI